MANPQVENGYTKIANAIMDALIAVDLSGQDFKITLLVVRKTYGFHKSEDSISLSQMMAATGMGKIRCSQVVNRLQLMNLLTVTENINGIGKKYKFNKNFESWNTVKENINRYKKTKSTVNVLRNPPLMKTLTTKDTLTKDTSTKDKALNFILPEWVDKPTWEAFLEMRKSVKAKPTTKAIALLIAKLKKLRDLGNDPKKVMEESITNNWKGFFELKNGGNNGNRKPAQREIDQPPEWRGTDIPNENKEKANPHSLLGNTFAATFSKNHTL